MHYRCTKFLLKFISNNKRNEPHQLVNSLSTSTLGNYCTLNLERSLNFRLCILKFFSVMVVLMIYIVTLVALASILFFTTELSTDGDPESIHAFSLATDATPNASEEASSHERTPAPPAVPPAQVRRRSPAQRDVPLQYGLRRGARKIKRLIRKGATSSRATTSRATRRPRADEPRARETSSTDTFGGAVLALRTIRESARARWKSGLDPVAVQQPSEDQRFCVIDLEEIKSGERAVRLPCLHEFHADCVLPYLRQQSEPCCPIDRSAVQREILSLLPVWTVAA